MIEEHPNCDMDYLEVYVTNFKDYDSFLLTNSFSILF